MRKILRKDFFERSADTVAKDILGKFLVRKRRGKETAYMITETEAYMGPHDLASHASRGKTKRNEIMFGPAGNWYIYLIYGMYEMLNIVTDKNDYPSAVLIRGVESFDGPGKLTRGLYVSRKLNGKKAIKENGLWIEDRGVKIPKQRIQKTPRVGVDYAGVWAGKPLRFVLIVENSKTRSL